MARFTVLEAPDGSEDRVLFIPEGFSWAAMIFSVFWALFHRLWVAAAVLIFIFTAIALADDWGLIGFSFSAPIKLAVLVVFGFEARRIQVFAREQVGYRRVGLVEASSLDAAELSYFVQRSPRQPVPEAPLRVSLAVPDTLGIFGKDV